MINTFGRMGGGSPLPSPLSQLRSPMMRNNPPLRRISVSGRSFDGRSPTLRSATNSPRVSNSSHKGSLQTQQILWGSVELPQESEDAPSERHLVEKKGASEDRPRLSPRSTQGSIDRPMKDAGSTAKKQTADSSFEQQQQQESTSRGSRDNKGELCVIAAQNAAPPLGSDADRSPLESDNGGYANSESSDCPVESKDVGREEQAITSHGVSRERCEDGGRNADETPEYKVRENGDGGAPLELAAIANGDSSDARLMLPRPDGDVAIDSARATKAVVEIASPKTGSPPSSVPVLYSGVQGAHLVPPREMAGEAATGSMGMQEAQARVLADPVLAAALKSGGPITPPTPLSKEDAAWLAECVLLIPSPAHLI
jgi:hypothetical protein